MATSGASGDFGNLGHGDAQSQLLPKKVEAFAGQNVVAVSAGDDHSLAFTADGAVWSWGRGGEGQLGHGDEQIQLLPKKVEAFAGQRVTVSAGRFHSLAITADGAVWSWGSMAGFRGSVAVSAGFSHSLANTANGAVFTWGKGDHACLGHGEDVSNQLLPKKIEAWAGSRGVSSERSKTDPRDSCSGL